MYDSVKENIFAKTLEVIYEIENEQILLLKCKVFVSLQ